MPTSSTELFVRESGPATAPAILFLHGSPLSSRMWLPQFERLTDYHCIAPDLPRHGQSAAIPLTTMRETTQRVAELIRTRAPNGRAHLVGLSYGGVVTQALMVWYPELLDHVLLSGTGIRLPRWLVWASGLNEPILRMLTPEQLAALVAWQFGIPRQYLAGIREDFRGFSSKTIFQVLAAYLEIETPKAPRSPTLVCVGQKETVAAKWAARSLVKSIPASKGVLVPGAGHVWNMEKPELFTATVRAWFADQPLPTELQPLILQTV